MQVYADPEKLKLMTAKDIFVKYNNKRGKSKNATILT